MEPIKSRFPDQVFSPRRKVNSCFALGVLVSVIVSAVVLVNFSLKAPINHPMFQGFSNITSNSSVSTPTSDTSRTDKNNCSVSAKSDDFLVSSDEMVLKNTHLERKYPESIKNRSFSLAEGYVGNRTHKAVVLEIVKNGNFTVYSGQEMVSEKTHHWENLSEIGKNGSSCVEGNLTEEIQHENFSCVNTSSKNFPQENAEVKTAEKFRNESFEGCDIFSGRWVRDDSKPYFPPGSCPHIDKSFDCHLNGRPDDGFLKWKWQPNGCDIPSLNATDFLERMRGKKLAFVGDSLNRNMWESLVCILRHSIADKKKVNEISGRTEFKKKGFYAFRFEDYNCTMHYFSTPFLVSEVSYKGRNGRFHKLRLDLMDKTSSMYRDADIIVFNTGHWWTDAKTSRGVDYFQEGNHVHPRLMLMEAYKRALATWARWVDKNIDSKRTQVFFRGHSGTHFSGGAWNSGGRCSKEVDPIFNESYLAKYPIKMRALQNVLQDMKTPVMYLNISRLTDYRKDGHPSIYRMEYINKTIEEKQKSGHQDCSHWCLPGVPDTWNELLYVSLLKSGKGSWSS